MEKMACQSGTGFLDLVDQVSLLANFTDAEKVQAATAHRKSQRQTSSTLMGRPCQRRSPPQAASLISHPTPKRVCSIMSFSNCTNLGSVLYQVPRQVPSCGNSVYSGTAVGLSTTKAWRVRAVIRLSFPTRV